MDTPTDLRSALAATRAALATWEAQAADPHATATLRHLAENMVALLRLDLADLTAILADEPA